MTVRTAVEEVYKTYTTPKHRLGSIIQEPGYGGREWRFAKNGAVALGAGLLTQMALPIADHAEIVCDVARAIGTRTLSATLGGSTVTVKDQYADGFVHVNKNTGIGHAYRIKTHEAAGAGAVQTLRLYEDNPLVVALVASSSELTLTPNKYKGILVHASPPTASLTGVTMCAVAANAYCWIQTKGPACVLASGTLVIGDFCAPSATTDGSVMPSAAFETDGPYVGIVMVVNITGEYALIDLKLG